MLSPAALRALRPRFAAGAEALAERLAARESCCGIRDIAEAFR